VVPEGVLVDLEQQAVALVAVFAAAGRRAESGQRIPHAQRLQGGDGIAGQVDREAVVRDGIAPLQDDVACALAVQGTAHGEAGQAATHDDRIDIVRCCHSVWLSVA